MISSLSIQEEFESFPHSLVTETASRTKAQNVSNEMEWLLKNGEVLRTCVSLLFVCAEWSIHSVSIVVSPYRHILCFAPAAKRTARASVKYFRLASYLSRLGLNSVRDVVKCPSGQERVRWIITNTIDVCNEVFHSCWPLLPEEICNDETCPHMRAGPYYSYLWREDKSQKPTDVSARKYVELLQQKAYEELKYPTEITETILEIWRRLIRVYFHIYCHHWDVLCETKSAFYINTCFKHLYVFASEFKLVREADLGPIQQIAKLSVNGPFDRYRRSVF
ncbi:hypothetical protein PROFUN_00338 [Planoprotostelium fungivorum]|uniref:Mob1/phocein family protein n=1 Tax=Planoprotostelium fungivorum TaxID=1890364 RepID=A0A2P6NY41_9EUKA|nr:hypothetical protein PROFUN_00338 [Planoprotostelium fungivorum]